MTIKSGFYRSTPILGSNKTQNKSIKSGFLQSIISTALKIESNSKKDNKDDEKLNDDDDINEDIDKNKKKLGKLFAYDVLYENEKYYNMFNAKNQSK